MNEFNFDPLWSDMLQLVFTYQPKTKEKAWTSTGESRKIPRTLERVWMMTLSNLQEKGGCIFWTRAKDQRGYGLTTAMGRQFRVHRLIYVAKNGMPQGEFEVCHTCDNPSCCNPNHLFAGSHTDNMRDMARKKRNNHPVGQAVNTNKLSPDQVREIRKRLAIGERQIPIAKEFGISQANISSIKLRQIWKHLL